MTLTSLRSFNCCSMRRWFGVHSDGRIPGAHNFNPKYSSIVKLNECRTHALGFSRTGITDTVLAFFWV
jgi:hypothetical protein